MPSSRLPEKTDYSSGSSGRDYKNRTADNGESDAYKSSKSSRTMPPPVISDRKGDYSSRPPNTSKEYRQHNTSDNSSSRIYDADERHGYSDRSRREDDIRSKPSGSTNRTVAERSSGTSRSRDYTGSSRRDRDDSPPNENADLARMETDSRSIYVGNVDYGAVPEDLEQLFVKCGSIARVTIPNDKSTGRSRGYAYIEFAERNAVDVALELDQSNFRGRRMKVSSKRTNKPYAISGVHGRVHSLPDGGGGGGGSGREGRSFRREYGGNGEPRAYSPTRSGGRDHDSGSRRYAPYDMPQRRNTSRYS